MLIYAYHFFNQFSTFLISNFTSIPSWKCGHKKQKWIINIQINLFSIDNVMIRDKKCRAEKYILFFTHYSVLKNNHDICFIFKEHC